MSDAPLAGLKVVAHASGVAAAYAARMLGTMGAAVTLVEDAAGSPLRREPPFLADGTSVLFAYLAAGMESRQGDVLAGLADADIFIDDTPVAARSALGIDAASIAERFPQLIHVSVLPFGATGPKAGWKGEDLIVQHAGGEGNLLPNGLAVEMFPDRAPLKIAGHFGEMQGGIAAALGALAAIWARNECGGQYVDISGQDANLAVGAFAIQRLGDGSIEHRQERSFRYGGVIPCADGFVELLTLEQRQWDGLVELLGRPDWALDPGLKDSLERSRQGPEINRHIRAWAATRHVDDIVTAGQKLSVPLARYKRPSDILADPQERHRGLFQPVPVGDAMLDMLVSPFHFDGAPLVLKGGPPPLKALPLDGGGLGGGELNSGSGARGKLTPTAATKAQAPKSRSSPIKGEGFSDAIVSTAKPLAGIRIADFTVHNAGPFCTHLLSQLGAEIIKVESAMRLDAFRKPHPVYGRMGPATFDQVASTKLSIRINLKKPEGIALARRLVAVSDVASESFRPGVMDRLGLGYDALRAVKADIVMMSVSSSGQSGPDSHFAGYAPLFGAWGGLGDLTGYADGPPVEIRHVMDHTVGMNAAVALMAALYRRRATGKGCHVDVAAREVAASLVGDMLLQAAAGGAPGRMGNAHPRMAPHGVYPARGEDRWLSLAVASDAEWAALARLIGGEALDLRFASEASRRDHCAALDAIVSGWTAGQDANEAAALLQAAGIGAHASWTTPEIAADPHLQARGAIVEVAEPDGTRRAAVGVPMRLSKGPEIGIHRGTPKLGEDEDYVYGELLGGMSRVERNALEEAEAIF